MAVQVVTSSYGQNGAYHIDFSGNAVSGDLVVFSARNNVDLTAPTYTVAPEFTESANGGTETHGYFYVTEDPFICDVDVGGSHDKLLLSAWLIHDPNGGSISVKSTRGTGTSVIASPDMSKSWELNQFDPFDNSISDTRGFVQFGFIQYLGDGAVSVTADGIASTWFDQFVLDDGALQNIFLVYGGTNGDTDSNIIFTGEAPGAIFFGSELALDLLIAPPPITESILVPRSRQVKLEELPYLVGGMSPRRNRARP